MRRRAFLATTGVALSGVSGCMGTLGTGGVSCDDACDVGMSTNAFIPETHETSVGSTVVWKNTSSRAHTITAYQDGIPEGAAFFASGGFESERAARDAWTGRLEGAIDPGGRFEHTFEVPGTYAYFCIPHEPGGMTGAIEVRK